MLGTIKRDLLLRGLDPNNLELDSNGMFVEKTKPEDNTTSEKQYKNAIVELPETNQDVDKSNKVKRKSKSE